MRTIRCVTLVCVWAILGTSSRADHPRTAVASPPALLPVSSAAPARELNSTPAYFETSYASSLSQSCPTCGPACGCGPNCQCGSGAGCSESALLCGCIAPSDDCYSDFISPLTNPLFFEDPRTLTEIRPIYASHWIPNSNAVFQGGNVQYLAAQIRIALTERLSIIATKDGFIWLNSENESVVPDEDGWADVAAGLKYNLIRDPAGEFLLSAGMTFELDAGDHEVFQGQGDGEFHFFATSGKALTDRSHWLSAAGYRQPTDTTKRSTMFYWSNHLDLEVIESWFALIEANWFHWTKSGELLGVDFEGVTFSTSDRRMSPATTSLRWELVPANGSAR